MKVFVTGAAGWIGSATVEELIKNGHSVLGLARNDANAAILEKLGAQVHRGDLEDVESLRAGAAASEGVLHLGFVHDFSRFEEVCAIDRAAISAMASGLEPGQPLVIASGTLGMIQSELGDENTPDDLTKPPLSLRGESALLVHQLAQEKGIRGSVVRLSPSCHGKGDRGFASSIVAAARKNGRSLYIEGADAMWPSVHRLDAAVLFRLALEKGKAGATYHGVAEQGIPIKDLAELIGRKLNVPVEAISREKAWPVLGFMSVTMAAKNHVSSAKTQSELGWTPVQKGWLVDIEENYFTEEAMANGKKYA